MKILLRSPFDQMTGYGRDGIGIAQALLDRGHDVRLSPTGIGVPIPRDIAGLLTYDIDPPFDLAIHHLEPAEVELSQSQKSMARQNIFWSMWEWEQINELNSHGWGNTFSQRTENFDNIVAYDPRTYEAFSPYTGEDRLVTVQGGYTSEHWQPKEKISHDVFTFGMNGKLTLRKGAYTSYLAFKRLVEAHPEVQAKLMLKSTEPIFPPEMPLIEGVEVIVGRWVPEQIRNYYLSLDCFLAPSWGEGKNLPPMEALTCGVPVILSDIPAHRSWANSDIATFVATTEKFCIPGHKGAYVDPDDLAAKMYDQYQNSSKFKMQAEIGSRVLTTSMDWYKCLERLGLACNIRI